MKRKDGCDVEDSGVEDSGVGVCKCVQAAGTGQARTRGAQTRASTRPKNALEASLPSPARAVPR